MLKAPLLLRANRCGFETITPLVFYASSQYQESNDPSGRF
jgi:hypothetical protein